MNHNSPMSLEVFQAIDAIERRGSFAKAAEELNKATSAISYLIQKLEDQLGVAVFQRQGRRSVLTPAGQLILEEGRQILCSAHRLTQKAKEIATGWEPKIRIAVEAVYSYHQVFAVLNEFLERYPSIEFDIQECVLNGGWELLDKDQVDLVIGIPGPVPKQKGYRAESIGKGDFALVIAAHHPLADQLQAEGNEPLISQLRRVVLHDTSQTEISRSEGLSEEGNVFYVHNMEQKIAAVLSGIGAGFITRHKVQQYLDSGQLIAVNNGGVLVNDDYLVWKLTNKGKGLSELTNMLISSLSK